jgi:hypothetical protein
MPEVRRIKEEREADKYRHARYTLHPDEKDIWPGLINVAWPPERCWKLQHDSLTSGF